MKLFKIFIGSGLLVMTFCFGAGYGVAQKGIIFNISYPQFTIPAPVYMVIEKPPEIITIVTENVTVKEIPQELKYFQTGDELRDWVDSHDFPIMVVAGIKWTTGQYKCRYYADKMIELAASEGYKLWGCPVTSGFVWQIRVIDRQGYYNHIGTMAYVEQENYFYYVESDPLVGIKVIRLLPAEK